MIQRCLTLAGAFSSPQPSLLSTWAPPRTQCCILLISASSCRSQAFAPLSLLCSSYPKYTSAPPAGKPCILPVNSLLVHLLLSPLSQLRSFSQLQLSTTEWRLHKNTNLHSSSTCLLIQLFFLAFASSFLQALSSLPVQLQRFCRFHWNLLWFLNILRDISFPNDKRSPEDTRNTTTQL